MKVDSEVKGSKQRTVHKTFKERPLAVLGSLDGRHLGSFQVAVTKNWRGSSHSKPCHLQRPRSSPQKGTQSNLYLFSHQAYNVVV